MTPLEIHLIVSDLIFLLKLFSIAVVLSIPLGWFLLPDISGLNDEEKD